MNWPVYLAFLGTVMVHSVSANARLPLHGLQQVLKLDRNATNSEVDAVGSAHNRLWMQRLTQIRNQVLGSLNRTHTPRVTSTRFTAAEEAEMVELYEKTLNETTSDENEEEAENTDIVKSVHFLTASCDPPRDMDPATWNASSSLRMFFDFSRYSPDRYHIVSARLKLHKRASYPSVPQDPLKPIKDGADGEDLPSNADAYDRLGEESKESPDHTDQKLNGTTETEFNDRSDQKVNITIYQLRYNRHNTPPLRRKHVETKTVAVNFEGWIVFSVVHPVQRWVESPGKNDGVEIVVESIEDYDSDLVGHIRASLDGCADNDTVTEYEPPTISEMYQKFYPILELVTSESTADFSERFRGRRSNQLVKKGPARAGTCGNSDSCCSSPLHVSFKELGMDDWILKPDGFTTSFCSGSCIPVQMAANHGLRQLFWKHRGLLPNEPKKWCCAPTRSKPLVLLYVCSDGHLGVGKLDDVITERCDYRA